MEGTASYKTVLAKAALLGPSVGLALKSLVFSSGSRALDVEGEIAHWAKGHRQRASTGHGTRRGQEEGGMPVPSPTPFYRSVPALDQHPHHRHRHALTLTPSPLGASRRQKTQRGPGLRGLDAEGHAAPLCSAAAAGEQSLPSSCCQLAASPRHQGQDLQAPPTLLFPQDKGAGAFHWGGRGTVSPDWGVAEGLKQWRIRKMMEKRKWPCSTQPTVGHVCAQRKGTHHTKALPFALCRFYR